MKKYVAFLACALFFLNACGENDNKSSEKKDSVLTPPTTETTTESAKDSLNNKTDDDNADSFKKEFNKYSDVQKYYFCTAFSASAIAMTEPETASAITPYFLGLGVAKYKIGIDDNTYTAFSFGRKTITKENIFNYVSESKVCENIISEAGDYAKANNLNTEDLIKSGQAELFKVTSYTVKERYDTKTNNLQPAK